ncbi:MAG: SDR family oxidoreductase [Phycisphaerae bacterium]|nr:SDR family oxidoreductase [Phycisphaerae bacterium]
MSERAITISGGSRGLGLELVRRFLELGDRVATFSRSASPAIEQLAADPRFADRLVHRAVDAADAAAVGAFVQEVGERFGRLDGLVNNAGIARDGVLAMMSDQAIREVVDVNLIATLTLTRECVRLMLLDAGAASKRIVNVSSVVGLRGYSGLSVYSATKAGVVSMTASLARELGPRRINVNSVAPGYLETDMTGELDEGQKGQIVRRTPLGRLGRTGDVVGVVEFLMSPQAEFVTGQTIVVDGGISC